MCLQRPQLSLSTYQRDPSARGSYPHILQQVRVAPLALTRIPRIKNRIRLGPHALATTAHILIQVWIDLRALTIILHILSQVRVDGPVLATPPIPPTHPHIKPDYSVPPSLTTTPHPKQATCSNHPSLPCPKTYSLTVCHCTVFLCQRTSVHSYIGSQIR